MKSLRPIYAKEVRAIKSLYNNLNLMSMVSALNEYFSAYFHAATRPMRGLLCGIVLAMLAFESVPSIRWMHRRLHLSLMDGSLNSYYRALKTCTVDDSSLVSHTVRIALSAIPSDLADAPLFLSVDDTIIAKAGQCFDFVSKLFDHAMHTGSAYVNGHCFVSLMLSVPVDKDMKGDAPAAYIIFMCLSSTVCGQRRRPSLKWLPMP